jgi:hypothetical protein
MADHKFQVIIDVYPSEDGEDLYFVGQAKHPDIRCPLTNASGFFVCEDDLNEWLEDHREELVILLDNRIPDLG